MKSAIQKEFEWRQKRQGKITASVLPALMTTSRKKGELFGAKALDAMYIIRYERRTGTIRENQTHRNFDWGNENEPLAIEWVRKQLPFNEIKSCSTDFPDIVFNEPFEGFGDSPDYYVYDNSGKIIAVGEIKCPIGQSKIEELQFLSSVCESTEYYYQLLGHFIGNPEIDILYYTIYDGYQNEGRIIEMKRCDYEDHIEFVRNRIRLIHEVIDESIRSGKNLIECVDKAQDILALKMQIETLKPQSKGNVPVQNKVYRLKKQLNKLITT